MSIDCWCRNYCEHVLITSAVARSLLARFSFFFCPCSPFLPGISSSFVIYSIKYWNSLGGKSVDSFASNYLKNSQSTLQRGLVLTRSGRARPQRRLDWVYFVMLGGNLHPMPAILIRKVKQIQIHTTISKMNVHEFFRELKALFFRPKPMKSKRLPIIPAMSDNYCSSLCPLLVSILHVYDIIPSNRKRLGK
jgi:hypothetical protein